MKLDPPGERREGRRFAKILRLGARKKDGFVRTNNQEEPPVIISCQSSSFLVQSRPWVHLRGFSL